MFKSTRDFEAAIYEILTKIHEGSDYGELIAKHGKENFDDALERAINLGYISGLTKPVRTLDGSLHVTGNPRLSYDGLKFIENFD